MVDPASYRPLTGSIPDQPGVYRFRDERGRVIYVGKAKNLRSRLSSYFADLTTLHSRTATMVTSAAAVDWVTVDTEVEALQLEYSWIKEYDPRFNVRYRDDKSYPYLAVTLDEEFPRVTVMRGKKRPGVRYFGPYAHAWAIRETVDLLLRAFPMRSCSPGVFKRHGQIGRPCLLGYISKCSAPCVGNVSAAEHRAIALDFCAFMAGQTAAFTRRIEKEMRAAAKDLDFERAAKLRDDLQALSRALERNAVVFGDDTDADLIALAEDPLEAGVQVFHVRGGRIRGERGYVVERVEDLTSAELIGRVLTRQYGDNEDVPREVLVPVLPPDIDTVTEWLTQRRGSKVDIRVPQRGDKRALHETAARNAGQILAAHKTRRAGDLSTRGRALEELRGALSMADAPLRIECIDVSHLGGIDPVGSLVVFEDGLPRKSDYRRFALRDVANDDVRAIREIVGRRFRRLATESVPSPDDPNPGIDPDTGRPRKFAYPPQLFVVDGGRAQAEAAQAMMGELGVVDITVVGLAKRLEEIWVPGESEPVVLGRSSEALYLMQNVRDEAHRFAITYQRSRRRPRLLDSLLDGVPGLGPARKKAVLREFGSLVRLRAASAQEIAAVRGIGPTLAASIVAILQDKGQ